MTEESIEGELYDMENDPAELINLWTDPGHAEMKMKLMNRLLDWLVDMNRTYVGTRGGEAITWQAQYVGS